MLTNHCVLCSKNWSTENSTRGGRRRAAPELKIEGEDNSFFEEQLVQVGDFFLFIYILSYFKAQRGEAERNTSPTHVTCSEQLEKISSLRA